MTVLSRWLPSPFPRASGSTSKDQILKQVAEAVLASTVSLPENIRLQVVQAMQDMRSETVIPRMDEWNTMYYEQFQDLLFHGKGTAADLAAKARPQLEELLPGR